MSRHFIHKTFSAVASKFKLKVAIDDNGSLTTYQMLSTNVDRLAYMLHSKNVGVNTIVGVFARPGIDLISSMLAIFNAGGIYMPIDASFSKKRLKTVFQKTFHNILIISEVYEDFVMLLVRELKISIDYLFILEQGKLKTVKHNINSNGSKQFELLEDSKLPEAINVKLAPETSNYIFYTSGSTGYAKPILGMHKSLTHFINWEIQEFKIDEFCRTSQLIQMTFDASFRDILVPLCTGGTVFIPSAEIKSNPEKLMDWLEESRISLVHIVPSWFRVITREIKKGRNLRYLRYILLAGEPLYVRDLLDWNNKVNSNVEFVNLYGLTETTLLKTFHRISALPDDPLQIIHVGKPISHTEILISKNGEKCDAGTSGEVFIKSPYLSKGYFKNRELNAAVFVANPLNGDKNDIYFRTGDIGTFLEDGNLSLKGRVDDQIKINGIRVEPKEIEVAVMAHPAVKDAVVVSNESENNILELSLYYTVAKNISIHDLRNHLKGCLNENLIPAHFILLADLPLNANGKVDKTALPKAKISIPLKNQNLYSGNSDVRSTIEDIFREVLQTDRSIDVNISFFEMGGNSIKAIQLISRIYKTFNIKLTVGDIYENSTINKLNQLTTSGLEVSEYNQITRIPDAAWYDLSHAQKRIWVVHQTNQTTLSNMPEIFEIKGKLDLDALQRAFDFVIDRHESLRTTFMTVDGYPKQVVKEMTTMGFQIVMQDITGQAPDNNKLETLLLSTANHQFDLENGPLIKCDLFKIEELKYVILINTHHIIADAWSIQILFTELFQAYTSFASGEVYFKDPLKIQYRDYANWHNKELQDSKLDTYRRYWLSQCKDVQTATILPFDYDSF